MKPGHFFLLFVASILYACSSDASSSGPRPDFAKPQVFQQAPPLPFYEFTVPSTNAAPGGLALGPDKNLWFTEFNTDKIGRLTLSATAPPFFTEFAIPTAASGPVNIASGSPSGNVLFFTESSANKVGRVTTGGVVSEVSTPTASSHPTDIILGPDGNQWFTETNVNKIGRLKTSSFTINEYSLPSGHAPGGITSASNGLWFTESGSLIGRITTAGVISEYSIPSPAVNITLAADGNLYFTTTQGYVGKMNTSGVYLGEFSIASGSTQGRLTKGPDGNPWFTESSANAIDSFVTSTSLFTPAQTIPTAASSPFGIASGPDGNLWFTERSGDKIGVYVRLEQTATPSSISFTAAGQTQTFSVSETNYTSDFKVSGCPTSIATVSPTGYAKKFTVKAVAAGTCTLTVSDTNGNGSPVSVVVTTTSVQIQ